MLHIVSAKSSRLCGIGLVFFLLATCTSARAADNWIEVRSPHFTVATNASEKEARKVADQFEQIRSMFLSALARLRVDPPQPILILAAKNQNTMKQLLPEEWETKGHMHPAGMYQAGQDKDYVILQLDAEGTNPFHALYHEYTHALLRLNFDRLPLWLGEGFAEFFGNSTLGEKESKTGTIDPGHLYILSQNKFLPIETLLEVSYGSPYYNEANRASIFYAQSWALVHYLMMDPEARKEQLLSKFLTAWTKSGNQVAAAQEAFGDLKRFGKKLESYAQQSSFQIGIVKITLQTATKSYAAQGLSPGEALALRGDFFTHHNRVEEAREPLEEALKIEPTLALAHEAMGFYHYRRGEMKDADKEMQEALRLGSTGFAPAYYHGMLLTHSSERSDESGREEARTNLEKAIQLNPQFAPAYDVLAQVYSRSPETQKKAIDMELKAVQLDPATHTYAVNLAYLLMGNDRDTEAKTVAEKILAAAGSPQEKQMASDLLRRIQEHAAWVSNRKATVQDGASANAAHTEVIVAPAAAPGSANSNETRPATDQPAWHPVETEGSIRSADCSKAPEILLTLGMAKGPLTLHAAKFGNVQFSYPDDMPAPSPETCPKWKGRKVLVRYMETTGKEYAGEIARIYFF